MPQCDELACQPLRTWAGFHANQGWLCPLEELQYEEFRTSSEKRSPAFATIPGLPLAPSAPNTVAALLFTSSVRDSMVRIGVAAKAGDHDAP